MEASSFLGKWVTAINSEKIKYTPEYIRKNADTIDFRAASSIIRVEELPMSIIEDYADEWDWDIFSQFQKLSEEVIRKFQDKVDWNVVLVHQHVSDQFLIEFKDRFEIEGMSIMGFKFKGICHEALSLLMFEQNITDILVKSSIEEAFERYEVLDRVRNLESSTERNCVSCTFQFLCELGIWKDFAITTG